MEPSSVHHQTIVLQNSPSGLCGLGVHHYPVPMTSGVGPPVLATTRLSRISDRQLG